MLPNLSFNAFGKDLTAKSSIELKSASIVMADKATCAGSFHEGTCYIFDEAEPPLVLNKVTYSANSKSELTVDLHLDGKDQENFKAMTKRIAGKRHVVVSINGKIVSAPLVKSEIPGPDLQISLSSKADVSALLTALGGK
jgi:preprotein translocase subunit SecD